MISDYIAIKLIESSINAFAFVKASSVNVYFVSNMIFNRRHAYAHGRSGSKETATPDLSGIVVSCRIIKSRSIV